jgi:hypothetical protein
VVSGRIIDLSLHGCRVETPLSLAHGASTDVVVRVNADSFRAVAEVREILGQSIAGLEFVQLTAGGQILLADLLSDLAKLHKDMNQFKTGRPGVSLRAFRGEPGMAPVEAAVRPGRNQVRFRPLVVQAEALNQKQAAAPDNRPIEVPEPLVIRIDLFG